ncbi:MAG: type II toxin-antitoxin system VapC family toxin [Caulobacteraceae bacterium]|nr:type II toxin-antitoxin system VapC family toxin [Caulobacteraceae bacterium]
MFLLDTNVISEVRKLRPHGGVLAWLDRTPARQLHICTATIGELQFGAESARRQHPEKARAIEAWIDGLPMGFAVLPIDIDAFRIWARLIHGRPQHHLVDALIAATALAHGLTIATRNVKDFEPFGVPILNPFETPRP